MKRLHVNIHVNNVNESINFYNALFNAQPTVVKEDYAKWMLEDPRVSFAISLANSDTGVAHLGIQAENETELKEIYSNIENADAKMREEGHTVCCYAQSEKSWVKDPQNVEWEAFHTYGEAVVNKSEETACCDDTCCAA
jgi:predicted enzyme related to lactoylglutathione lyase